MKQMILGVLSGSFKENAEELYGYPTIHKMIDGILTGKSAFQIVEDCRPPHVEKEEWGKSELAKLIQRLLLKTGVNHPETNLFKEEIGLGERIFRAGDVIEDIEVLQVEGKWTLMVRQNLPSPTTPGSYVMQPTEVRTYDSYAEAVDDWLWATR